ncbi:1-deoxy-D-xylulose-5-phosphate synthase [Anaerotignum neopropionicum]|uniref:1-deoxy-D-xylulose-5-phosphate synthase n=1 Tax=Anaerotignum neopropionicum TaxID=36847 RepID=A0A136WEV2_9FIRM|nr:1-deoxy-D-xylulose-5-phosphate synthase [Anaerotignum neopropionicum]KXL53056.1 1-deoxy-D-xylulose-5-phosphate synthase [Anaerotignum neopropionicum]
MGGLLDKIQTTGDIKKLKKEELDSLCKELRCFLIQHVCKTGGHLASNLGVVELTVALEYIFNLPEDKIVWDVGHQAYIHKILTGRKNNFPSLRQLDGLSGFPKPGESEADVFAAGHSSTSISAALGIAKARDLQGKNNNVIAVIGDGSMTGGLAYEALNNAGREKTNFIVILNDNQMSIDHNVGAISKHLNSLRTSNRYRTLKDNFKQFRDQVPLLGKATYLVLEKVRDSAKLLFIEGAVFEEFGFKYIGPVDGHNLEEMIEIFQNVKDMQEPILIHVKTTKGKGYLPAETNPGHFHGVGPFDMKTGNGIGKSGGPSWSAVFGKKMVELGKKNPNVVGITAAMCSGTGFEDFQTAFPERFFDVAIAEQHGTTFSAGLASQGIVPVFAVYSSFLQRAYDQVIHDVCMENLHVVFAIDRAGIVGADGETHQGVFDLSFLTHIPNMTVLSPKNAWELEEMLEYAVNECKGPVAVRYPRGTAEMGFAEYKAPIQLGKAEIIQNGNGIAVLAEGHMLHAAQEAVKLLEKDGVDAPMLVNMRFISPLDEELLEKLTFSCKHIFTVEDNLRKGGFGSKVLEFYSDGGYQVNVTNLAFPDQFIEQGSQSQLFFRYGLDGEGIFRKMKDKIGENYGR